MSSTSTSTSTSRTNVKEYSIRVPKSGQKRFHVMRFNSTLDVAFDKWTQVKMERENNMKEYKGFDEDQPKFGAGSEFGREAKEEARRKKLGIISRKYKPDDQPWILKSNGSTVKKFKGIREGGVSENAAYYVFTHAPNQVIEAYPLQEWYKFQPIQRYKALSAEEAEQEFSRRNKHLNFFSLMLRKRLKGDEDIELEGEEEGKGKGKKASKAKELTISEMDEWMETSDDDSDEEGEEKKEEDEEKAEKKKKNKKNVKNKKKSKKRDTNSEAFEDSDDGDGEGRELDYITDSSDSEPENNKLEGVSEEKGMRKLLNSDEESENDSDKSDKDDDKEDEEKKEKNDDKSTEGGSKEKSKNKKKKAKKEVKKEKEKKSGTDSDFSSDSSTDEDIKKKKAQKKAKKEKDEKAVKGDESNSANSSRSGSPTSDGKRKLASDLSMPGPSQKKAKVESLINNYIPGSAESGITEDAVRKYLMRKPMTTTELLQKFKSKKTGLSSEQLVNIMTQILKKINPVKQMLKGKMYLSIKS